MENYKQLAESIVELFYPLVECTLLDKNGRVHEIFNSFSKTKEEMDYDVNTPTNHIFGEFLKAGRNVRTLIRAIHEGKECVGFLRIRYDLTHFKNLQEQLNTLIHFPSDTSSIKPIDSWTQMVDQTVQVYLNENKINLQAISAKHKREILTLLRQKGLLEFKESSTYVASKLQVSRATIYNYLKTVKNFQKVHVHQVDAFTNTKFGGNPAGVVLDADDLDEATMRKIARELNLSETAFVFSSKKADFKMRYFTPTGHEIAFCGHSTVGALFMIAKEKRFGVGKPGLYPFKVETKCGILNMEVKITGHDEISVGYEAPKIILEKTAISHQEFAQASGLDVKLINPEFPIMYEKTNKDLFLVARSLKALKAIEYDSKLLTQFSKQNEIVVTCILCNETFDSKNLFHMRCFAPLVGITEDPFTGSVLGGLTAYVDRFGLIPKNLREFQVEQGHFVQRPGVVKVEFSKNNEEYQAKIFAQAIHCFSTEINLT